MLLPAIETWKQWGAMFTSVPHWTPAVQEICRRTGISARHIEAGYPGTNAVFVLDQTYVVKIYAPFCHADFELERALYPIVSEHTRIPSPRLLAQGVLVDAIRWPYIVMDYKPGQPIREVRPRLGADDLLDLASTLGAMVRQLHQIPLRRLARVRHARDEWAVWRQLRMKRCIDELRREDGLPAQLLDEIDAFLRSQTWEQDARMVLVNGDLTEDHILMEKHAGRWRISGLLDFADALIAPREYEWIALWFGALESHAGELQAFMRGYDPNLSLDDAFFHRALAFTFLHQFGAGIIATTLERLGRPRVRSLPELSEILWGFSASW